LEKVKLDASTILSKEALIYTSLANQITHHISRLIYKKNLLFVFEKNQFLFVKFKYDFS